MQGRGARYLAGFIPRRSRVHIPPLLFLIALGCSRLPPPAVVVQKIVDRPVIELVLHGEDAGFVTKQAERYGGVVDLDAMAIGCVLVYLTPGAFADEGLRRHEFCHCRQARRDPAYALRYAIEHQLVGYERSKFEVECRAAQDDVDAPTADRER